MTSLIQSRIAATAHRGDIMTRLFAFAALAKQRRTLRGLEPHLLRDIGLTQAEAQKEAARPIWDAPKIWSR